MGKQTYEQAAYQNIKEQILCGKLQVGDHISEMSIALALGISRTPVRRALAALETDNLVEIKPNKGAIVSESMMTTARFIDMLELMEMYMMRTVEKIEHKGFGGFDSQFTVFIERLENLLNTDNQDLFLDYLVAYINKFIAQIQNSYVEETLYNMQHDFNFKAQKELKVLPHLLGEETIAALKEMNQSMRVGDFIQVRRASFVKPLICMLFAHSVSNYAKVACQRRNQYNINYCIKG